MATDQASADYEWEQARRETLHDNRAEWAEDETPLFTQPVSQVCGQCLNWQPKRQLHPADGTTVPNVGSCLIRAAAARPQMPQSYAERCQFYREDIPF